MKYSDISQAPKLAVRESTAAAMLESRTTIEALRNLGLRPLPTNPETYLVKDIQAYLEKLKAIPTT